jgi:hypothetical protein
MLSSKTHGNKAYMLMSVYDWMKTFEDFVPHSAKIEACRQHMQSFANNAKHAARYQLPANFDEHSMICRGNFFAPKEYMVYVQWVIVCFNKLVDKIVKAKEEAEQEGVPF